MIGCRQTEEWLTYWEGGLSDNRGQRIFSLKCFEHLRDIPAKILGCPAQKFGFPAWVFRDIPFRPTPSHGRPPPHPKISGPKSLRLGSFFSLRKVFFGRALMVCFPPPVSLSDFGQQALCRVFRTFHIQDEQAEISGRIRHFQAFQTYQPPSAIYKKEPRP